MCPVHLAMHSERKTTKDHTVVRLQESGSKNSTPMELNPIHAKFDRSNIRNTFLFEESDIDKSCDFPSNRSEAPSQLPVIHQENDYGGLVGPHITYVNGDSKIRTPSMHSVGDYSNASHISGGSSSDPRHQEPEVYYSPLRHIDGSLYGEHGSDSTINAAIQYENVVHKLLDIYAQP